MEVSMSWEWRHQDRAHVLECLRRGEYEAIVTSRQSALDTLAHLAYELGVLDAASVMTVTREREGIPDDLLLRTLVVLPFVEALGLSAAADMLFEDAAILLQLGYTALQLREGFNARRGSGHAHKSERALPCHPDVLRQELARLTPESIATFRRTCIRELFRRKLIKGQIYALDGSGLGTRYRVVGLLNVSGDQVWWVSWRVLSGSASEKGKEASVVHDLVDEVRELAGADAIALIVMDALYADGPLLAWLKYARQIDALVRLPEDRLIYTQLWALVHAHPDATTSYLDVRYVQGHKQLRRVTLGAMGELTEWDSFREHSAIYGQADAGLWGLALSAVDQADPTQTETWALISTRTFASGPQAYATWRRRWRIENNGFRELKEGWHLEAAPWSYTDATVVEARVTFTCVAFNVAQLAKTAAGRRLIDRGIRRLRRELVREYGPAPVIVFAGGAYGIFHIEEVMQALGRPPLESLRRGARAAPERLPDTE
jgi:hypothetical protein